MDKPVKLTTRPMKTTLTIMSWTTSLPIYAAFCAFLLHFIVPGNTASNPPRLQVTSPLNPVEEAGILSLHCQVWHVQSGQHEVTIQRTITETGSIVKLSVDDVVLVDEDNAFLAVRQLQDGSTVYFLTIMDVTSSDKGSYTCRIVNKSDNQIVESGSVDFTVTHFPGDSDPICEPNDPVTIKEGDDIVLVCHSQIANPRVQLEWTKSGDLMNHVEQHESKGRVYSTLRYRATRKDDGAIFQCELTSSAFPDKKQTCHIGPLNVERDPNALPVTDVIPVLTSKDRINGDTPPGFIPNGITPWSDAECRELCGDYSSTPVLYWVITTVVAAIIALIFFIMGITLLIRYYRVSNMQEDMSPYGAVLHAPRDSIYSELESRRISDNKVYMTLEKGDKILHKAHLSREHPQLGHYDTAPKMPKF